MLAGFEYATDLIDRFPDTRGGVIEITGISNGRSSASLRDAYVAEQSSVRAVIGDDSLAEIPSVAAWRRTFTAFGVKPTQYRSAIEALLRRLTKAGDIPSINTMVDIANLVSIRHKMPVAVFDQASVVGRTIVRFAAGNEQFTDLGSDDVSHPEPGEVIFVDDADVVSARRWCWRQSAQSAAGSATKHALVTIEGQHESADEDVARATRDLVELVTAHQPDASVSTRLLGTDSGSTSV